MKKIIFSLLILVLLFINSSLTKEKYIENNKSFITLPNYISTVATTQYKKRMNHERLTNKSKFYFENNNLYNNIIGLVATNTKKIIDVSSYQGIIDWEKAKPEIDGVIVRIGFGYSTEDSKLQYNIQELNRLKIPYGIYLYSYAENKLEALEEAKFTEKLINKYDIKPTLGIYYDIEEFYVKGKKVNISKEIYQKIIETYINHLNEYKVNVYTYAKMYKYKFNETTKKYITWIAQYNYYFTYKKQYKMWQYTDSGIVNGVKGYVDINVMFE